jgi:hypothetical protein
MDRSNARDGLRVAQLAVQREGLRHPYYWAAFQLTGAAGSSSLPASPGEGPGPASR